MNKTISRIPSAVISLVMSLLALAVLLTDLALSDTVLFQLLLFGQAPFVAVKWLPRKAGLRSGCHLRAVNSKGRENPHLRHTCKNRRFMGDNRCR